MKLLKKLNENLEMYICVLLMSLMTIIIFIQVIMRYAFSSSLSWSEELARYLFIWLIYIGISYGAKTMKHIRIEAALKLYPKKMKYLVIVLSDILFLSFSIFIVYTGFVWVQRQIAMGQRSPAMQIPMWIVYAAPMVGFSLTSIRQVQILSYWFKNIFIKEEHHG